MKDSVERYSAKWYPYPWPAAINVAGPAGGMEYPGIVFDDIQRRRADELLVRKPPFVLPRSLHVD